jgi:hypothetical protein
MNAQAALHKLLLNLLHFLLCTAYLQSACLSPVPIREASFSGNTSVGTAALLE